MAGSMADYLDIAVPDYLTETLSLSPQDTMTEDASKNQTVREMDDDSVEVISLSDTPVLSVTLKWDILSASEADTLMDFWLSSSKANGRARTFKWAHPTDGHVYVARFNDDISRDIKTAAIMGIASIELRIEGYVS